MLADECERPLLQPERGVFLDADFGPFGMAPEGSEHGDVGVDPKRIIAPVAGGDHAAVEVEDAGQFVAVEAGDGAPVPEVRERRDDAQALLTLGWGWRAVLITFSSLRSSSISRSSSAMRARTGSTSSPHGVP